jgi:predicted acetyltransferase
MSLEIRPITPDEFGEYMIAEGAAFGGRPTDAELEQRRAAFEHERSLAAFEDRRIVGTAGAYAMELTLPGGVQLAVPGVSWVSVLPTHRRRGILTALKRQQLEDIASEGHPLAMLTASESAIYGRFGYGIASSFMTLEIDRLYGRFAPPRELVGRLRLLEHEPGREALAAVYDRVRRSQPGAVRRDPWYWQWLLNNPHVPLEGQGPRFYLAYETPDGAIEGAAHYRIKGEWTDGLPNGTLVLRELYAATPEAYAALWSHCLNVDLVRTVRAINRPVDDPIRWVLADPRRLRVTALSDDLWLRVLDVPRALAARRYSARDALTLEVHDAFRSETAGRYVLDGGPEGAECRRTDQTPDLALAMSDLGAAYLGGVSFTTLARAGRVRELTEGALRRADALFTAGRAPYCGTPF